MRIHRGFEGIRKAKEVWEDVRLGRGGVEDLCRRSRSHDVGRWMLVDKEMVDDMFVRTMVYNVALYISRVALSPVKSCQSLEYEALRIALSACHP